MKSMMHLLMLLFATSSLLVSPSSTANAQTPSTAERLKQLDRNNDGRITKEEAGGAPWFNRVDQNKDGVLDAAELQKLRQTTGAPGGGTSQPAPGTRPPGGGQFDAMVKSLDKNADGKITRQEAGDATWFERADQNKDGVVSAAELQVMRQAAAARADSTPATPGSGAAAAGQIDAMLKAADKNRDGKISREEAGGAPWFDRVDQNKDGVIDASEGQKLRNAKGAGGGRGAGKQQPPLRKNQ